MPTDGELKEALHDASILAKARFNSPARRQWLEEAIDVATDAVLRSRKTHDPARNFLPYARTFVRRALKSLLRTRLQQAARRPSSQQFADHGTSGLKLIIRELPEDMLVTLTLLQREVLRCKYERSQSFAEIGRARGTSKQSAHRVLIRALIKLKKQISKNP